MSTVQAAPDHEEIRKYGCVAGIHRLNDGRWSVRLDDEETGIMIIDSVRIYPADRRNDAMQYARRVVLSGKPEMTP